MEHKTISHLNGKAWYRLIKVVYLLIFVLIFAVYNFLIFSDGVRRLDYDKTSIVCNTGGTKTFALKDANAYIDSAELEHFDYGTFFGDNYETEAILNQCMGTNSNFINPDAYELQNFFEAYRSMNATMSFSDWVAVSQNGIDNGGMPAPTQTPTYDYHMFDITPSYTYAAFAEYFIVGNLIIALLFLLIRGTFFYVALGNFRPKKN